MITEPVKGTVVISGASTPAQTESLAKRASNTSSASPPQAQKPESVRQREEDYDQKTIEEATQRVAQFVGSIRSELSFSVDQVSGINVVKVIDANTKEVIRQFPSREIIQLAQALDKLQGLFVKDKA